MVPLVSLMRSQRERAREILPPELHVYLEQRVLAASWYPEEHLLGLLRAGARLVGGDPGQVLRNFGRFSAQHHLGGIYAHLGLEGGDPLAYPRRAFALWSSQHDTGRLRVTLEGRHAGSIRVEGYDSPSAEMCDILWGYIFEVFVHSGMGEPRLEKRQCCNKGDDVCEWGVGWAGA